ncbi:hypothetical protein B0H11DRAFT_1917476 [Mycena galericulata]|nr:hypothetical protein B0H11DRAFT_1917476 [Mycena galericulata]
MGSANEGAGRRATPMNCGVDKRPIACGNGTAASHGNTAPPRKDLLESSAEDSELGHIPRHFIADTALWVGGISKSNEESMNVPNQITCPVSTQGTDEIASQATKGPRRASSSALSSTALRLCFAWDAHQLPIPPSSSISPGEGQNTQAECVRKAPIDVMRRRGRTKTRRRESQSGTMRCTAVRSDDAATLFQARKLDYHAGVLYSSNGFGFAASELQLVCS